MTKEMDNFRAYAPRHRYRCPHCAKRFKAVPMLTEHSPYPVCPRCGVPVGEENHLRAFDRTRKVLRVLFWPALLPIKLTVLSALGVKASTVGIFHLAAFLLMLPVTFARTFRQKRFASPEVLEKYLSEVKGQWKGGAPGSGSAVPCGAAEKAVLTPKARQRLKDDGWNPHALKGTVTKYERASDGRRTCFIQWPSGRTGGPYYDEDVKIVKA